MQSQESEASCSSSEDLLDCFKNLRVTQVLRPQSRCRVLSCQISGPHAHDSFVRKIQKRRKPVFIKHSRIQKVPEYNHSMPAQLVQKFRNIDFSSECVVTNFSKFPKRDLTTIKEESFQMNKKLFLKTSYENRISKNKEYQEKVASLKAIVGRLTKVCLEKPETLQNDISDETILLFKEFNIEAIP